MGGPTKLLLPFRGCTVLETTLDALCQANIGPVRVVTGHARDEVASVLAAFAVEEVQNPDYRSGLTSSIQAGVRASAGGTGFMICLADMPGIAAADYRQLAAAFSQRINHDERAILLPRFAGNKGNPVIFSAVYRREILAHAEPEGCRSLVQAYNEHVHWVDMADDAVLRDLDTPEDFEQ